MVNDASRSDPPNCSITLVMTIVIDTTRAVNYNCYHVYSIGHINFHFCLLFLAKHYFLTLIYTLKTFRANLNTFQPKHGQIL